MVADGSHDHTDMMRLPLVAAALHFRCSTRAPHVTARASDVATVESGVRMLLNNP
jgi:hypothetical protein